jgi:hypothetical protein
MDYEEEIWVPLPSQPDVYQISNLGRVRRSAPAAGTRPGRILKPFLDRKGYVRVTICVARKTKILGVHRELARAFLGDAGPEMLVRHLNDVKADNRLANLAWGTAEDNYADAVRNGVVAPPIPPPHGLSKLARAGMSDPAIARRFGVSSTTVAMWRKKRGIPSREVKPSPHGSRTRYASGCRCEPCTVANRIHQREYRANR